MKISESAAWAEDDQMIASLPKTVFSGYTSFQERCTILKIFSEGAEKECALEGDRVLLVLDHTPFYAEGGGQAGDSGTMVCDNAHLSVLNVRKTRDVFLHEAEISKGIVNVGDTVLCTVNATQRNRTARNHTATHLLHAALRQTLGDHVQQAGSYVDAASLRFDFSHYESIHSDKIDEIEVLVNRMIDEFLLVTITECSLREAKEKGAMALFDEKYGETVRMVEVGDFSTELCGGTHVRNSGEIGAFRITAESSIGSGTRRIEALTGSNILSPLIHAEHLLKEMGEMLKTNPDLLIDRVHAVLTDVKDLRKELDAAKQGQRKDLVSEILAQAKTIGTAKFVHAVFDDYSIDELRHLCDEIRGKEKDVIAAFASKTEGKALFIVAVSDSMQEAGYHAGKIVKEMAAICGGGGGGKADMAQSGAKDVENIAAAIEAAEKIIANS
jgi:alanyl-tRNA synthetase